MAFAVPLDVMPLFEEYSVTVAIGGLLALAVAWHVASTGRVRSAPAPILLLAGFAAWAAASLLWAADLAPSVSRLTTVLQLLAFVWLGWQMARSRLDLRLLLAGFLAGCAVVAGGAWRSFLGGLTVVEMVGEQEVDFDDPRYAAIGFDPNDMGVTLAIGIPIAAYLALTGERRWRHLWFAYVPLALSGIALSGSRGAMITAVVAIACVVTWTGRRSLAAAGATLALVVAGVLSVWWLKPETWERALTFRQQIAGGTLGDRLPIWRAAWDVLRDHPVAGVAIGGFPEAVAPFLTFPSAAHNTVLSVLVELGLVGGLLYFGAVVAVLLGVRRSAAPDRDAGGGAPAHLGRRCVVAHLGLPQDHLAAAAAGDGGRRARPGRGRTPSGMRCGARPRRGSATSGQHLLVEPVIGLRHPRDVEGPGRDPSAAQAHGLTQAPILAQPEHGAGHRRHVPRGDEEPGLPVAHHLGHPADGGGDDRATGRHGLHGRERVALVEGGQHEHVAGGQQVGDVAPDAEEADPRLEAQRPGLRLERASQLPDRRRGGAPSPASPTEAANASRSAPGSSARTTSRRR